VGLALAVLRESSLERRRVAVAAAAAILLVNVGYLWTKKRTQFFQRAEPTEQLIRFARQTPGPIFVRCFPRNPFIAEEAVRIGADRPAGTVIWSPQQGAATFCYQGAMVGQAVSPAQRP
jgi:hypothetical protein